MLVKRLTDLVSLRLSLRLPHQLLKFMVFTLLAMVARLSAVFTTSYGAICVPSIPISKMSMLATLLMPASDVADVHSELTILATLLLLAMPPILATLLLLARTDRISISIVITICACTMASISIAFTICACTIRVSTVAMSPISTVMSLSTAITIYAMSFISTVM